MMKISLKIFVFEHSSFCQNKDTRVRKNFLCTLSHTFPIFAL